MSTRAQAESHYNPIGIRTLKSYKKSVLGTTTVMKDLIADAANLCGTCANRELAGWF